jgi:predicted flavoprotein YhiN
METRNPSLYAIGEAFDVTGWPGGCNFQLARANGVAAGDAPVGWRRHEPVVTATPIGHNVRDS